MKVIDVHAHLLPRCFWNAAESQGHWYGNRLLSRDGNQFVDADRRVAGPMVPLWRYDADERVQVMDRQGVDLHLVSVAPFFTNYHLEPKEGLAAAREVNDEIAGMVHARPARFAGLATLPMQDPGAASAELERSVNELGLKGVELVTNVVGKNWDSKEFYPFFETAERLGAFLFFHPHAPAGADRTADYYLGNLIGNPLDTTITIASLIFGGVLDKFPRLKLCFAHGGGYACFGVGRMDHGTTVRHEPKVNNHQEPPSDYLGRLYYDCLTHSGEALKFLLDRVGADRVMLGSDYPFDMGFESPAEWVNTRTTLNDFEKRSILGENAQRVLQIPD